MTKIKVRTARLNRRMMAVSILLCLCGSTAIAADGSGETFGWVEFIEIEPWSIKVKAKLDSGALTSSMQAENIEVFQRGGESWVRFNLEVEDEASGEVASKTIEKPRYRDFNAVGAGGKDHREVVLMHVCIGDTVREEQFSLDDRDNMIYPVLLGRRTIQSLGKIDVTATFINDPRCAAGSAIVSNAEKRNDEDIGI